MYQKVRCQVGKISRTFYNDFTKLNNDDTGLRNYAKLKRVAENWVKNYGERPVPGLLQYTIMKETTNTSDEYKVKKR